MLQNQIYLFYRTNFGAEVNRPVLQILGTRKATPDFSWRRVAISDGVYYLSTAALAPQLSHLVDECQLQDFTIIRVDKLKATRSVTKTGKITSVIIIIKLTILHPGSEVGTVLGAPVKLPETQLTAAAL